MQTLERHGTHGDVGQPHESGDPLPADDQDDLDKTVVLKVVHRNPARRHAGHALQWERFQLVGSCYDAPCSFLEGV